MTFSKYGKLGRILLGAALGIGAAFNQAGCVRVDHTGPISPVTGSSGAGRPTGDYVTDEVWLSWSGIDLDEIRSLEIRHPAPIRVQSTSDSTELQVFVRIDLQTENHRVLAQQFRDEALERSRLEGTAPLVQVPSRTCTENRNSGGELERIRGICVRELLVYVPASKPIELKIASFGGSLRVQDATLKKLEVTSLPVTGSIQVTNTSGDVALTGTGGAGLAINVDRLRPSLAGGTLGSLIARLQSVRRMIVNRVPGKVMILPATGSTITVAEMVSVDGRQISEFPYDRAPQPTP